MKSLPFKNTKMAHLAALAERWGGKVIKLSNRDFKAIPWDEFEPATLTPHRGWIPEEYGEWFEAPFTYRDSHTGVNFKDKIVVYAGNAPWPNVLHEMGHVFATTDNPELCSEEDFLGWEYQIGKGIDIDEWLKYNKDYQIDVPKGAKIPRPIDSLPRDVVIKRLEEYLQSAKSCGLVTRRGTLKTLRESCPRCYK